MKIKKTIIKEIKKESKQKLKRLTKKIKKNSNKEKKKERRKKIEKSRYADYNKNIERIFKTKKKTKKLIFFKFIFQRENFNQQI